MKNDATAANDHILLQLVPDFIIFEISLELEENELNGRTGAGQRISFGAEQVCVLLSITH